MFSTLQFLAIAVVASFSCIVVTADVPDCARTYIVQSQDCCDAISFSQHVSVSQLRQVNNLNDNCDLLAGETLCLGVLGQDCHLLHVVKSSEFESADGFVSNKTACDKIISDANLEMSTLLHNNPSLHDDCSEFIYAGMVLCKDQRLFQFS